MNTPGKLLGSMKKNPTTKLTGSLLAAAGLSITALAPSASAAVGTWVGNTDSSLGTAANWSAGSAPVSGDSWYFAAPGTAGLSLVNNLTSSSFGVAGITFSSPTNAYVIDSAHTSSLLLTGNISLTGAASGAVDQTIGSNLIVNSAITITLNVGTSVASGNLLLTGNLSGSGTITQTAQNTTAKSITFSGDNSGFSGSFIQDGSSANRTAFNSASSGSANAAWIFNRNVNGGTALNFTGATINFGSLSGGGYIRANTAGTVNVSVGALGTNTTFSGLFQQSSGTTLMSVTKVGSGVLSLSFATGNGHSAGTAVNAGTLLISNTSGSGTGTGAITVAAAGTLGGSGIIAPTVAGAGITVSGALSPGGTLSGSTYTSTISNLTINLTSTTGTLQMLSGASFKFELGTAGTSVTSLGTADKITLTGASAGDLVLNNNTVNFLGTGAEGYYVLIDGSSASANTVFSGLTFDSISGLVTGGLTASNLASGLEGKFFVGGLGNGGTAGNLYLQVVPEPSSIALIGLAAGAVVVFRRRRCES